MKTTLFVSFCLILFFHTGLFAQPVLSLSPVITTDLTAPLQLVNAGDGTERIFIVQRGGTIIVFNKSYSLIGTFLTVSNVLSGGERGLLSMVFHPNYKTNGFFYVYYTNAVGDLELARYQVSADVHVADPASKVILLTLPHTTYTNHNGGELHFANDGYLYISTGDGGGGGDPLNNAQNTSVLLGKILRLNVNTSNISPYYTIPVTNPFGNEVYAYGLRNPYRWSFDRLTQDMWIADVGQDNFEEIDYRPADSSKGVNYGWRCYEGTSVYESLGCGPIEDYTFPVYQYPTPSPGSVIGGTVYRGNTYVSFRGYYIAADYFSGIFYKIKYDTTNHTANTTTQALTPKAIADFGETEDGELYAVMLSSNSVYRIISDGPLGYTFIGEGNWDIAANWSNNIIPPAILPAGAEIIIDPKQNAECLLNVPQTISAGSKLIVNPGKKFNVNGNLVIQ